MVGSPINKAVHFQRFFTLGRKTYTKHLVFAQLSLATVRSKLPKSLYLKQCYGQLAAFQRFSRLMMGCRKGLATVSFIAVAVDCSGLDGCLIIRRSGGPAPRTLSSGWNLATRRKTALSGL